MKKSLEIHKSAKKKGREWSQIVTIMIASLASFSYGIHFSWLSPSIPALINDKINYDISLEEVSYFSVITPVAAIFVSPIYGWLVDKIGRKPIILSIALPHFIPWMLIAFTNSIWILYLARFINGIADACFFSTLPVYISEISTPEIRGSWGNLMSFGIFLGQFFVVIVGGYMSIRNTALICSIFPIIFVITFIFAPETPYYYIMKNKLREAKLSLQKLRVVSNVNEEFEQLQADVNRQTSESASWRDLFTIPSNKRALRAAIFLRVSQQLSGPAPFFIYNQYFFEKAGGNISPIISSAICYGILVLMNIVASSILDKLGRRLAFTISLAVCTAMLFVEATYFYLIEEVQFLDVSSLNWVPLFGLVMYTIFFQIGLGLVPTLMLGELFSQNIKGKALCLLNILLNVGICVTSKLFQVMESNLGMYAPFVFFGICSIVSIFMSFYLVPETKGKTLEEIQQNLKKSGRKT